MPKTLHNVREDILAATRSMIAETGYDTVNIRGIAARCGIGTGTFYNYFSSKQEVLSALIRNDWELALRKIDRSIRSPGRCTEKLQAIFEEISVFSHSMHGIWLIEESMVELGSLNVSRVNEKRQKTREQLEKKILEAIHGTVAVEHEQVIAGALTRIFLSYCMEDGFEYQAISVVVEKLLE